MILLRWISASWFFFAMVLCAETASTQKQLMHKVLASKQFWHDAPFLIGQNEWQELGLARYVAFCDTTVCLGGTWGLTKLTESITCMEQLRNRQASIIRLSEDRLLFSEIEQLLEQLHADEHAVLSYFNERDKLLVEAKSLYYPRWLSWLNESSLALDIAGVYELGNAAKDFAALLFVQGFIAEFFEAYAKKRDFKFMNALMHIKDEHSLAPKLYHPAYTSEADWQDASSILLAGTFGDRWRYLKRFGTDAFIMHYTQQLLPPSWGSGISFCIAGALAVGFTLHKDYAYAKNLQLHYGRLKRLHQIHCALQEQIVAVARYVRTLEQLSLCWQKLPYFAQHAFFTHIYELVHMRDADKHLKSVLDFLHDDTCAKTRTLWYSRGHVLLTHAQLQADKDKLIPLLQAVALTDGFMSIARYYITHKEGEQCWTLASFIEAPQPILQIDKGYSPLVTMQQAVANDCLLGHVATDAHMLITGPSGAGKSTYLKMIGGLIACAQSWTIVPAKSAQLTLFATLCTSFDPHEDLQKGISTFMAQQRKLEQLKTAATLSSAHNYTMLLIDEPYRGTIEAEAEKRAYQFCSTITQYPFTMAVVACHLQEPIALADQTQRWCNRQVVIESIDQCTFNCTYKVVDGPAWWWFNDLAQRINFIDWLLVKDCG